MNNLVRKLTLGLHCKACDSQLDNTMDDELCPLCLSKALELVADVDGFDNDLISVEQLSEEEWNEHLLTMEEY